MYRHESWVMMSRFSLCPGWTRINPVLFPQDKGGEEAGMTILPAPFCVTLSLPIYNRNWKIKFFKYLNYYSYRNMYIVCPPKITYAFHLRCDRQRACVSLRLKGGLRCDDSDGGESPRSLKMNQRTDNPLCWMQLIVCNCGCLNVWPLSDSELSFYRGVSI